MNTVIIINLDYETLPVVKCKQIWAVIEMRMTQAGFAKHNRLFATTMKSDAAFKLARSVMAGIEEEFRVQGESVMQCVREFYGVPHSQIVDLAAPLAHEIEVDLMATGAFQKFFS